MDRTEQIGAGAKLALLSNVNMDFVIRLLRKQAEVWQGEGYGNELGTLMNPGSSYHAFDPEITFLVMDLMELLGHDLEPETAGGKIDRWFQTAEAAMDEGKLYYISDTYLWGMELSVLADAGRKAALEYLWQKRLEEACAARKNVRILPFRQLVEELGADNAFSMKMWYMGKIPLGNEAQKRLCTLILDRVRVERRVPKKVLLLDLDNTLWGGLAGEQEHTPVELSEEHGGLAYKNLQRVILQMQKQGVLLGIVSKNNEADAMEILERHPHMVLRPDAFAARRINWAPKHENIRAIAEELNLGMDSFVFWDDSPQERLLVKEMLPQVTVPDFPGRKEELALAMAEIYREYFARPTVTEEDKARTAQYAANTARKELQRSAGSFEAYLRQLEITAVRVSPRKHMERLLQLLNKTNQFNLTTRRYTQGQLVRLLETPDRRIYLYSVSDRFGDNGVVAAAAADCRGEVPVLTDFVMSCRVMGKNIEYALMEDIEKELRESGYKRLRGIFIPTAKNMPVAGLYDRLGYRKLEPEEIGREMPAERGDVSVEPGIGEAETVPVEPGTGEAETVPVEPGTGEAEAIAVERGAGEPGVVSVDSQTDEWQAALAEPGARVYEIRLEDTPFIGGEGIASDKTYFVKIERESEE